MSQSTNSPVLHGSDAELSDIQNAPPSSINVATKPQEIAIGSSTPPPSTPTPSPPSTPHSVIEDDINTVASEAPDINTSEHTIENDSSITEQEQEQEEEGEPEDEEEEPKKEEETKLQGAFNKLSDAYISIEKRLNELYCSNDAFNNTIEDLSDSVATVPIHDSNDEDKRTDIQSQIDDLEENIKITSDFDDGDEKEKEKKQREQQEIEEKIRQTEEAAKKLETQVNELKKQNAQLQEKIEKKVNDDEGSSKEALEAIKKEKTEIEAQLAEAQRLLGDKGGESDELKKEKAELVLKHSEALEERKKIIDQLEQQKADSQKQLEILKTEQEQKNKAKDEEMERYQAEIEKLSKNLEKKNETIKTLESQKGKLSEEAETELAEAKSTIQRQQAQVAEVNTELAKKKEEIKKQIILAEEFEREREERTKEITRLKQEIEQKISENKNSGVDKEEIRTLKANLDALEQKRKTLEETHKAALQNKDKEHNTIVEERARLASNKLQEANVEREKQKQKIIELSATLKQEGAMQEVNKKKLLEDAERAEQLSKDKIGKLENKISELNARLAKAQITPQNPNPPLPYRPMPSPAAPVLIKSEIVNAPYLGIKVSFPKDRIGTNDGVIAPLKGNELALAIIPTTSQCWYWKSYIKGSEAQIQDNKNKMRFIEDQVTKNHSNPHLRCVDNVYIHSVNGNIIAPSKGGIPFSTRETNPLRKFQELAKGNIQDPLKITFIHKREQITVFIQRFKELKTSKEKGCSNSMMMGGKGDKEVMDLKTLNSIYELQFKPVLHETEKLKKEIPQGDNGDIHKKFEELDNLNNEFKQIYENNDKNKLTYRDWKIIKDPTEIELNIIPTTDILSDLLYNEIIKTVGKKDYIKINFESEEQENAIKRDLSDKENFYIRSKKKTSVTSNESESETEQPHAATENPINPINPNPGVQVAAQSAPAEMKTLAGGAGIDEEYLCIPIIPITDEDCKRIRILIKEILDLLKDIRESLNISISPEESERDSEREREKEIDTIDDDNEEGGNKTISGLMNQIRTENFSSSGTSAGDAAILTKSTMIIYNIILGLIVILCIFTIILHIFNIIKFLYETFLEIGKVQHNNLETGETFRYKLLNYITYVNSCDLPSLFSSFNSTETTSTTIIKLSQLVNDFFKKSEDAQMEGATEFKNMLSSMNLEAYNDEEDRACEEAWEQHIREYPNRGQSSEKTRICQLVRDERAASGKQKPSELNNKNKEPIFNIFMVMRLFFMSIKLYLAFFMIVVIVFIIFILLTKVAALTNMPTLNMNPFAKQISFTTLLQASGVCFIYIIISFVLYKFVFIKIYNKYLETYLHIITIDLELNKIKSSNEDPTILDNIHADFASLLHDKIDNDHEIEDKIIDFILDDNVENAKIEKYILYYVLIKHIYDGKNKVKLSHLKVYNYFINTEANTALSNDILIDINTTYYSLIPNKYRKVPLQYYKFDNIKRFTTEGKIKEAEAIRKKVNSTLSILNDYIVNINKEFDDDNYIVNLGWYFLINLGISTIFTGILVIILVRGWNQAGQKLETFLEMK